MIKLTELSLDNFSISTELELNLTTEMSLVR